MEFHVFTNPQQGSTYDELVATARTAEELGLDGFFRSDHYQEIGVERGFPGSTDAWVSLGALARETARIRLGTLATAATFRLPGPLAVAVAQVDQMSGGRVDFGFDTGWFEPEHRAYGVPFPGAGERVAMFEEQLEIITGLWDTPEGKTFSYDGLFDQLVESPGLPKPVQRPRPPIVMGGRGKHKTPRLVARFADEYNYDFPTFDEIAPRAARIDTACEKAGRDPATLPRSVLALLLGGRSAAEIARRSYAGGLDISGWMAEGLTGSAKQITDRIGQFPEAGITRFYLQTPRQLDRDHWEFFVGEVLPRVR